MLNISMNQIRDMESQALEAFLQEMEAWAAEHHGPRLAALPPEAVRDEVQRARALGFVLRGHVKRWLCMAFEFGFPFAARGWAAEIAADARMIPAVRLDMLEREGTLLLLAREEQAAEQARAV